MSCFENILDPDHFTLDLIRIHNDLNHSIELNFSNVIVHQICLENRCKYSMLIFFNITGVSEVQTSENVEI